MSLPPLHFPFRVSLLGHPPQLGQLGHLGQLGQLGHLGQLGQLGHLGHLGELGHPPQQLQWIQLIIPVQGVYHMIRYDMI